MRSMGGLGALALVTLLLVVRRKSGRSQPGAAVTGAGGDPDCNPDPDRLIDAGISSPGAARRRAGGKDLP